VDVLRDGEDIVLRIELPVAGSGLLPP